MNVNDHCGSLWYTKKKKILIYQNNELIYVAQIQRKEVEDHLQTTVTFHLGLAFKNVQDTTEKLDLVQQQVQDLAAANTTLSRKVDEQNKTILRLKSDSLDFVWKVTGFREILSESKYENNKMLKSVPFYTAKQGYKLRLCIKPNGDQTKRNKYLSVYVLLMKGNYDGMLPWPFRKKVTLTLIDQVSPPVLRWNVESSLHVAFLTGKPKTEEVDESQGILRFISHTQLNSRCYLMDDTLFLQVKIDPTDI